MGNARRLLLCGTLLFTIHACTPSPRFTSSPTEKTKPASKTTKPPALNTTWRIGQSFKVIASYYGEEFHGRLTANGEVYDMYGITAAHKTLPFNTVCRVTNLTNDRSVILRINDRGPFIPGRELDLSYGAAKKLGVVGPGTAKVRIEILKVGENEYAR